MIENEEGCPVFDPDGIAGFPGQLPPEPTLIGYDWGDTAADDDKYPPAPPPPVYKAEPPAPPPATRRYSTWFKFANTWNVLDPVDV